jgi:hypothetical protein
MNAGGGTALIGFWRGTPPSLPGNGDSGGRSLERMSNIPKAAATATLAEQSGNSSDSRLPLVANPARPDTMFSF